MGQVVENVPLYPGKRYQVRSARDAAPVVRVEVWTGSRGRGWRTLPANRSKESAAVLVHHEAAMARKTDMASGEGQSRARRSSRADSRAPKPPRASEIEAFRRDSALEKPSLGPVSKQEARRALAGKPSPAGEASKAPSRRQVQAFRDASAMEKPALGPVSRQQAVAAISGKPSSGRRPARAAARADYKAQFGIDAPRSVSAAYLNASVAKERAFNDRFNVRNPTLPSAAAGTASSRRSEVEAFRRDSALEKPALGPVSERKARKSVSGAGARKGRSLVLEHDRRVADLRSATGVTPGKPANRRISPYLRSPAGQAKLAQLNQTLGEMQAILKTPGWQAQQRAGFSRGNYDPYGRPLRPPGNLAVGAQVASVGLAAAGTVVQAGLAYRESKARGDSTSRAAWEGMKAAAPGAVILAGKPAGAALSNAGGHLLNFAGSMVDNLGPGRAVLGMGMSAAGMPWASAAIAPEMYLGAGAAALGGTAKVVGGVLKIAGKAAAPAMATVGAVQGAREDSLKPMRGAARGAVRALDPTGIYNPTSGWFGKGYGEMAFDKAFGGPQQYDKASMEPEGLSPGARGQRSVDLRNAQFRAANERYMAMRDAARQTDPDKKRKGWSNAARIGAAKARGAVNLPYGGDPSAGPQQWRGPM